MRTLALFTALAALTGCETATYCDGDPEPCSEWIDVYLSNEQGDPVDIEELSYIGPADDIDSLTYCEEGWCQVPYDDSGSYTFTVVNEGVRYTLTTDIEPVLEALGSCCDGPVVVDELSFRISAPSE